MTGVWRSGVSMTSTDVVAKDSGNIMIKGWDKSIQWSQGFGKESRQMLRCQCISTHKDHYQDSRAQNHIKTGSGHGPPQATCRLKSKQKTHQGCCWSQGCWH